MELKLGKCKGMTVEQVLSQQGGDKLLAGHLAFVEKGFNDPQWGEKNKLYYNALKGEWARLTAKPPAAPQIQQAKNEVKMGPSDSTKLDILNKQLHEIATTLKKLDEIKGKLIDIEMKMIHSVDVEAEVKEALKMSPETIETIVWEE